MTDEQIKTMQDYIAWLEETSASQGDQIMEMIDYADSYSKQIADAFNEMDVRYTKERDEIWRRYSETLASVRDGILTNDH